MMFSKKCIYYIFECIIVVVYNKVDIRVSRYCFNCLMIEKLY